MTQKINIAGLRCKVAPCPGSTRIAYMLYPMDLPSEWMLRAARHYGTHIVAISEMDWDNDLTPWPAAGVPAGEPPFKGEADSFLELLRCQVVPRVEAALGFRTDDYKASIKGETANERVSVGAVTDSEVRRSLIGVSLSGLFTLWQWMKCDTFTDIGCLSGSFWYAGFADWMEKRRIPHKTGRAFFLLGDRETYTHVKAFQCVASDTDRIVNRLRECGIHTDFRIVPGDHYASPIPRLEAALTAIHLAPVPHLA